MSNYSVLIAPTSLALKRNHKAVPLGLWCDTSLNEVEVPYHWNDKDKMEKDFYYLEELKLRLIPCLAEFLNNLHNKNYSDKSWNLILGSWLNYFVTSCFDKYENLRIAIKKYDHVLIEEISSSGINSSLNDTKEFFLRCQDCDSWNNLLYEKIAAQLKGVTLLREDFSSSELVTKGSENHSKINYLRYIYFKIVALLKRSDSTFVYGTSLPNEKVIELEKTLGQFPFRRAEHYLTDLPLFHENKEVRDSLTFLSKNHFEFVLSNLIINFMPRSYIEGFQYIESLTKSFLWPKNVKSILTSTMHYSDDIFKHWLAVKSNNGTKVFVAEHGGLGLGRFNGTLEYDLSISDGYFTTGWNKVGRDNILPVGNFRKARIRKKDTKVKNSGLYIVLGNMPRYAFDIRDLEISSQNKSYLDRVSHFLKLLIDSDFEKTIRLYPNDYGWNQKLKFTERGFNISIDRGCDGLLDSIQKHRLFVGTYNATTFLETFSINFPTVIFWDPFFTKLSDQARKDLSLLEDVGVYHQTPTSAAEFIKRNYNNISEWWNSHAVQEAISSFKNSWLKDDLEYLIKISRELRHE